MATDYDAPQTAQTDELSTDLLELTGQRSAVRVVDADEAESPSTFEVPEVELSDEELSVWVIPKRPDEFVCSRCFLVYHRSRLASAATGQTICADCVS